VYSLQTVHKETNPRYYRLIEHFRGLTGIPAVLNTRSTENERIVCYPEEALERFFRTEMELLVLENFFLERKKLSICNNQKLPMLLISHRRSGIQRMEDGGRKAEVKSQIGRSVLGLFDTPAAVNVHDRRDLFAVVRADLEEFDHERQVVVGFKPLGAGSAPLILAFSTSF
jgi:hypothetical protein